MVVATIHFLLSFLYEKSVFIKDYAGLDLVILEESISPEAERILGYICAKILAFFIIFVFWRGAFNLFLGKYKKEYAIVFGILFAIGILYIFAGFPDVIYMEGDSLGTYYFAMRNMPFYWHSMWTSSYFAACFMFLPHPFSIVFLQMTGFMTALTMMYAIMNEYTGKYNWTKFLTVLFILLYPDTNEVMLSPYRNCTYTVLVLLALTYVVYTGLKKNENSASASDRLSHKLSHKLLMVLLFAFIAVWRSEGIVFGFALFVVMFAVVYRLNIKQFMIYLCLFLVSYKLIGIPQSFGDSKYYGSDYLIISTIPTLQNIFNDSTANLTYEGASEDIAAIEAVCPLVYIQQEGTVGYRSHNFESGYNINQTGAADEAKSAFISAVAHLVIHNPMDYAKTIFNNLTYSLGLHITIPMEEYAGEERIELNLTAYDNYFDICTQAKEDIYQSPLTSAYAESAFRQLIQNTFGKLIEFTNKIWEKTKLSVLFKVVALSIAFINIFIYLVRLIKNKGQSNSWLMFLISGGYIAAFILVALSAPSGRGAYYYPVMYSLYFMAMLSVGRFSC